MTLKEFIFQKRAGQIVNVIIQRIYEQSARSIGEEGYLEISIDTSHDIKYEDDYPALVKIHLNSTLGDYEQNTDQWHDMIWCNRWEVVTALSKSESNILHS